MAKPKPIKLKLAFECDFCHNIYKTKKEAYQCCEHNPDKAIHKNYCPNCEIHLRHIKGVKERIVMTLDGLQEWSFNSSDICRKCDYKKEYNDVIDENGRLR